LDVGWHHQRALFKVLVTGERIGTNTVCHTSQNQAIKSIAELCIPPSNRLIVEAKQAKNKAQKQQ